MAISYTSTESGAASYISNGTPTTGYTSAAGAGKTVRCEKCIITNVTGTARTVTIFKVPSGGSISGTDYQIDIITVPANTGLDIRKMAGAHLDNGDSWRFLASAASALRIGTLDTAVES